MSSRRWLMEVVWVSLVTCGWAAQAQTASSLDSRVQPPTLTAPERGSMIGQLASTVFGPADVSRGAFSLPPPFTAPEGRGPLLAKVFPTYSPDAGISEWGMGWQPSLSITRFRIQGDLDYVADELTGPWGRMVQGADGYWYPAGLSQHVRIAWTGDTMTAWLPDGGKMTFGGPHRVTTARGTYAWHLTEAVSVTGRRTQLMWQPNPSGRLFLSSVSYGGTGQTFQNRIDFSYEPVATPFTDYRSGEALVLDARVKQVAILARHAHTGQFEPRWRFDAEYVEEGLGPAYYLSKVTQVFPSGDAAPPLRYSYRLASDHLPTAELVSSPKIAPLLLTLGADVLQPNRSASFDGDLDGLPDLEHNTEYTWLRQTDTGFTLEPLPAAPSNVFGRCRRPASKYNPPRLLASMLGDDTHYVVDLAVSGWGMSTTLSICDRLGQKLGGQTLSGDWQPGPNVRLVDLTRDRKPDLVRVLSGSYRVLVNTSSGSTFSFASMKSGPLTPAFMPSASWVRDFNGDGVADLIARSPSSLVVWFGTGEGRFVPQGQAFTLETSTLPVVNLKDHGLTFVDANKDGLQDVVLSANSSNATYLFMNQGKSFKETVVPGLRAVDLYASRPTVADLSGSGNTEVTFTRYGEGLRVVLDEPGTGLLASVDDGKGTILSFAYDRAAPVAGAHARQVVITALEVASSGNDTVRYEYEHAQPTTHSGGKYLVGFDAVTQRGPGVVHAATFLNGDAFAGLSASSNRHDTRSPGLHAHEVKLYEDALFHGIPWKRVKEARSGYTQQDGQTVEERVAFLQYEAEVCPAKTVRHTSHGTLTTQTSRASVGALVDHLHCLAASTRLSGSHADSSLDFVNEVRLTRNAIGQVQKVEDVSATGDVWVLQEAAYRPDALVDQLSIPGRGALSFEWQPGTLQLSKVLSPDGVVVEASQLNPVTDALLALTTRRGSRSYTQSFTYDNLERLQSQWDDLGAAGPSAPNVLFGYQYATGTKPASVTTTRLVDAALGVFSQGVEWYTAAGETLASGTRIPQGWTVGSVTTTRRALLETRTLMRPPLVGSVDVTALDYASLLAATDVVGVLSQSGLGLEATSLERLHANVQREVDTRLLIDGGLLKQEAVENGTYTTRRFLDATRHVIAHEDEAGTRYTYAYDALGRLRQVLLPDGARHRVAFDGHGRVAWVGRDDLASVDYVYAPTTGLLAKKTFRAPGGSALREESYTYDAIGRKTKDTHRALPSGQLQSYAYYYDGRTPTSATPQAQDAGLLTAVSGDGYTKHWAYRVDGKPTRQTVNITGWRTVVTTFGRGDDGHVRDEETCVRGADGTLLSCDRLTHTPDGYGRPDIVHLDGVLLADLAYDDEGQLSGAGLAGGTWLSLRYDALTRAASGFSLATPGFLSTSDWRFDARGLIGGESFGVGAVTLSRVHTYSAQRFLTRSTDAQSDYAYAYAPSALPTRIEENGAVRTLSQTGQSLTAGSVTYLFDGLGRTVQKGALTLSYGPNGHLSQATDGTVTWTYVYDEAGQRLMKLKADVPVAAYLPGGGHLDGTQLTLPLKLNGRLVGVIQDGVFKPLAADMRNTVLSDFDGTSHMASPYGSRMTRPESSAAIDFVEKGYDPDLGLVRMGVRDYDAAIGRFTKPDPLFLESPELCVERVAECNAYGYAGANPVSFTDPTGKFKIWPLGSVHEAITRAAAYLSGGAPSDALIDGVRWPDVPGRDSPDYAFFLVKSRIPGTVANRSHYGDLQFWHSMASGGERTNQEVVDKIVGRAQELWSNAGGLRGLAYAELEIGKLLHTVQDSYSRSHVVRDGDGRVLFFQNYSEQDEDKHGEADKGERWFDIPGAISAVNASTEVLRLYRSGADFAQVEKHLREVVYPFAPGADARPAGGSADAYKK